MAKRMERRDGSGKGSRAALALSTLLKHRRAVGWSRCVWSSVPCLPSPWPAATPWHLPVKAVGLGRALACHAALPPPAPETPELPELPGCRSGKDGERCLPYLGGQIASSCGQIKSDGERLDEGVCFPCKANSLSLFPAYSGSSQAALWAGNLLCRGGNSGEGVRDGRPGQDGCPPAHLPGLATGFAPVLERCFIGRALPGSHVLHYINCNMIFFTRSNVPSILGKFHVFVLF